jgi:putative CocE/NonD family hydrolase
MRDGAQLDATVWRPTNPGRYPVILERMGYELLARCAVNAEFFARRGYVFVGQNTRGSYDSEGIYGWTASDGWGDLRDGYDTVEWAGTRTWSNGNVGMLEGSYSGITQYLVAPTRPSRLKALFIRQASPWSHAAVFRGGAFPLFWLGVITRHVLDDERRQGGGYLAEPLRQAERQGLIKACGETRYGDEQRIERRRFDEGY